MMIVLNAHLWGRFFNSLQKLVSGLNKSTRKMKNALFSKACSASTYGITFLDKYARQMHKILRNTNALLNATKFDNVELIM